MRNNLVILILAILGLCFLSGCNNYDNNIMEVRKLALSFSQDYYNFDLPQQGEEDPLYIYDKIKDYLTEDCKEKITEEIEYSEGHLGKRVFLGKSTIDYTEAAVEKIDDDRYKVLVCARVERLYNDVFSVNYEFVTLIFDEELKIKSIRESSS